MAWIHLYRLRHYLSDSVWIGPCLGIVAALLTVRLTHWLDVAHGWKMSLDAGAAQTVLITLASAMFTFVVFVSSALLIALQLASVQLTPRIIAFVFRDLLTKFAMTVFVFTFTLTVAAVLRIGDWVPALTVHVAAYACVASLGLFLYLIDHIGKILRPANALRAVALRGRDVIESVYPLTLADHAASRADSHVTTVPEEPGAAIASRKDGVVLACDIEGLANRARRAGCVIEIVPQVGDFIARGDPLFRVYGRGAAAVATAAAGDLRRMVAIGHERSLEQDPAFAFRIIVDIASKALSPAINDPTTAVLAIDQLQHLLALVGSRHLDDERVRDRAGPTRLLCRTPGWDDFVHLAVTEVRQYGGESIQVNRRLRAMLESLLRSLPEQRAPALRVELELLTRSTIRFFAEPEDQAMAAAGDCQGVGGHGGGGASETGGDGRAAPGTQAGAAPAGGSICPSPDAGAASGPARAG